MPATASMDPISEATEHGRGMAFATTQWSMVLAAQEHSPVAEAALEKLCRTYWWPLYGFVRRDGYKPEDAQDLVQGFFALLLARRDLDAVRREKGRLRSYLLVSLKNFVAKARRRELAVKRGKGCALVSLDELREREEAEPLAKELTAERKFDRDWALRLLEQVLARLAAEYEAIGNRALFTELKELFAEESDRPSQAQVAGKLGMGENAVKQAFHRFRCRYRELLREEIAQTVAAPGDLEDELRHLVAALRT